MMKTKFFHPISTYPLTAVTFVFEYHQLRHLSHREIKTLWLMKSRYGRIPLLAKKKFKINEEDLLCS